MEEKADQNNPSNAALRKLAIVSLATACEPYAKTAFNCLLKRYNPWIVPESSLPQKKCEIQKSLWFLVTLFHELEHMGESHEKLIENLVFASFHTCRIQAVDDFSSLAEHTQIEVIVRMGQEGVFQIHKDLREKFAAEPKLLTVLNSQKDKFLEHLTIWLAA